MIIWLIGPAIAIKGSRAADRAAVLHAYLSGPRDRSRSE
jgi:hypothetical protein